MEQKKLPSALYTAAQVRQLDRFAIEDGGIPGLTLMRRAASACVDALIRHWPDADDVLVYCGSGNNAGDGYLAAGMLAEKGRSVRVAIVGKPEKLGPDATEAWHYCSSTRAQMETWQPDVTKPGDVIVDALLGTGLSGDVRERYARAIAEINNACRPVLSVDIPSGLSADTGARLGTTVRADVTVTFIGVKRGMLTLDGPDCCGEIEYADLDVPHDIFARIERPVLRLDLPALTRQLPRRPRNAHKNQFGHVLVVGGDEGMGGAALMSAEAALRCGAGLVSVVTHPAHVSAILARRPELMVRGMMDRTFLTPLLSRANVVVLGPGLGGGEWGRQMFEQVMGGVDQTAQTMVVDADGLNLLAEHPRWRPNWVLTPHPGEAANLMREKRLQDDRFDSVSRLQQAYGGTVLLKGAGTLIADGNNIHLCPYGNPGMSTAGMGDVLSGVIAGLLAQGLEPAVATWLGVAVHAASGDACAVRFGERGLVATDLLVDIRRLLNP